LNEHQYRRLCENRRIVGPLPLGEPGGRFLGRGLPLSPLATVVAAAARTSRRREKARAAWQRLAQPEWLATTAVEAVDGDTLVVAVDGPALRYDLQRHRAALDRALAGLVPGLRRVRFVAREPVSDGGE
jgi:hypothetical protein